MSKATPRPWRRTKPQGAFGHEVVAGEGYLNTKLIAQMSHLWGAQDVSEANAELIVRAVNAHDDIVEVLEACRDYLQEEAAVPGITGQVALRLLHRTEDVLAKARGG